MASFGMVIRKKNGDLPAKNGHMLMNALQRQFTGLEVETVASDSVYAAKMWLRHSRSHGFAKDTVTGSWLACVGNPVNERYGIACTDVADHLLKDFLCEGQGVITGLNPPFVIVLYDGRDQEFHVFTDRLGIQHIYIAETKSSYVISTSSLALASTIGANLDPEGLVSYFLGGIMLGMRTFYQEIKKIDLSTHLCFSNGTLVSVKYWSPPRDIIRDQPIRDMAKHFLKTHARAVSSCISADGKTSVEVTGGLDSRLNLLCALKSRKPFHGWTIGESGCPEVQVTENLKKLSSFDHHTISSADCGDSFEADLKLLTHLLDGEMNSLNLIASPTANRQTQHLRHSSVSGVLGEIVRGPYYFFFKGVSQNVGEVNVQRLIGLKMLSNVCGDMSVFSRIFPAGAADCLRSMVKSYFVDNQDMPLSWRLDHYYFTSRGQRFAGRSSTMNNFFYRQHLPYFTNDALGYSFQIPFKFKRNSLLLRHAMQICNPKMANVALDKGLPARPLTLLDAGSFLPYYGRLGEKGIRRLLTKFIGIAGKSANPQGIDAVINMELSNSDVLNYDNMASNFLYDPDRLKKFISKNVQQGFPYKTQIGLMLTFEYVCQFLGSQLRWK